MDVNNAQLGWDNEIKVFVKIFDQKSFGSLVNLDIQH
jgi:hypothetical protein